MKIFQKLLVRNLQAHHKIRNHWTKFFPIRNLLKWVEFGGRGKIPETFLSGDEINF